VLDRWDTAIESRVEDPMRCVRIGVMQRLHEADWAGHVLAGGGWIHLYIPMEYEPDVANDNGEIRRIACRTQIGDWQWSDPRTKPGELLQPERFPLKLLRGSDDPNATGGKYKVLGSYGYAGQMQQRPAPADGGMFKRSWWKHYDSVPDKLEGLILSVDCNAKKTINGSRTSLLLVGRKGPMRFILDNDTRITDIEETVEAIIAMRKKWPNITMTIVEDKANGPSVVSMLKKRIGRIEEQKVGSDSKESRARAVAPIVQAGDVFLPREAAWLDDFMHELSMFPNGARDDQVDALSQALIYMEGSNDAARFLAAWG
jgi:predicted phage terminase large subunit-like protein